MNNVSLLNLFCYRVTVFALVVALSTFPLIARGETFAWATDVPRPDYQQQLKNNKLLQAIEQNDLETTREALSEGAQLYIPNAAEQPLDIAVKHYSTEVFSDLVKRGAPTQGMLVKLVKEINIGVRTPDLPGVIATEEKANRAHDQQLLGFMEVLTANQAIITPQEATENAEAVKKLVLEHKNYFSSPSLVGAHLIENGFDFEVKKNFGFSREFPLAASRPLAEKLKQYRIDPWGTLSSEDREDLFEPLSTLSPKINFRRNTYRVAKKDLISFDACDPNKTLHLAFRQAESIETAPIKALSVDQCKEWVAKIAKAVEENIETLIELKEGVKFYIIPTILVEEPVVGPVIEPAPEAPLKINNRNRTKTGEIPH